MDVDDVSASYLHALFLFAEGTEEVFRESPVEECSVFVDPCALEVCEVADTGQWLLGGGYEAFVLVEIEEDVHFIVDLGAFGYVFPWQKYFALASSVEVESEVYALHDP